MVFNPFPSLSERPDLVQMGGGRSLAGLVCPWINIPCWWASQTKEKLRTAQLWMIQNNLLWKLILALSSIAVCQKCIHNALCVVLFWNSSKLYLREASLMVIARRISSVHLRASCCKELRSNLTLQLILWSSSLNARVPIGFETVKH